VRIGTPRVVDTLLSGDEAIIDGVVVTRTLERTVVVTGLVVVTCFCLLEPSIFSSQTGASHPKRQICFKKKKLVF
jgi:hypothetical protein